MSASRTTSVPGISFRFPVAVVLLHPVNFAAVNFADPGFCSGEFGRHHAPEPLAALLVRGACPHYSRPVGPGGVIRPVDWRLGQNLYLNNLFCSLPASRAHAVAARISASYNHDLFIFGVNCSGLSSCLSCVNPVLRRQVVHCVNDVFVIASLHRDSPRFARAHRQADAVELFLQVMCGYIFAHGYIGP